MLLTYDTVSPPARVNPPYGFYYGRRTANRTRPADVATSLLQPANACRRSLKLQSADLRIRETPRLREPFLKAWS